MSRELPTYDLLRALSYLPPDEREIVVDRHMLSRSWKDIAHTIGITPMWAQTLDKRGLQRLHSILSHQS